MIEIIFDASKLKVTMSKMAEKVKDYSQPFEKAGNDLIDYFGKDVFDSQGEQSTGLGWRRLAESTLYMRANHYGYYANRAEREDHILVWTGRLRRGFVKRVDQTHLVIGNNVEYFPYHQLGGGRLPQRKMLTLNRAVVATIKTRIEEHIEKI